MREVSDTIDPKRVHENTTGPENGQEKETSGQDKRTKGFGGDLRQVGCPVCGDEQFLQSTLQA